MFSPSKKDKRQRSRTLRIEELESREMLSVSLGEFDVLGDQYTDSDLRNDDYGYHTVIGNETGEKLAQMPAAAAVAMEDTTPTLEIPKYTVTQGYPAIKGLKANARKAELNSVTLNWNLDAKSAAEHREKGTEGFTLGVFDPSQRWTPLTTLAFKAIYAEDGTLTNYELAGASSTDGKISGVALGVTPGSKIGSFVISVKITGLEPQTKYTFTAQAGNSEKHGSKEFKFAASTAKYPAVKVIAAKASKIDSITLYWAQNQKSLKAHKAVGTNCLTIKVIDPLQKQPLITTITIDGEGNLTASEDSKLTITPPTGKPGSDLLVYVTIAGLTAGTKYTILAKVGNTNLDVWSKEVQSNASTAKYPDVKFVGTFANNAITLTGPLPVMPTAPAGTADLAAWRALWEANYVKLLVSYSVQDAWGHVVVNPVLIDADPQGIIAGNRQYVRATLTSEEITKLGLPSIGIADLNVKAVVLGAGTVPGEDGTPGGPTFANQTKGFKVPVRM